MRWMKKRGVCVGTQRTTQRATQSEQVTLPLPLYIVKSSQTDVCKLSKKKDYLNQPEQLF